MLEHASELGQATDEIGLGSGFQPVWQHLRLESVALIRKPIGQLCRLSRDPHDPRRDLVDRSPRGRAVARDQAGQLLSSGCALERCLESVCVEASDERRRVCGRGTPRSGREPEAVLVSVEGVPHTGETGKLQHPGRLGRARGEQIEGDAGQRIALSERDEPC